MGSVTPNPKHEALYQELVAVLRRHGETMPGAEMLAVASNMVGKLLAMQDQRAMTPRQGMEIISRNIEIGNREMVQELRNSKGGTA